MASETYGTVSRLSCQGILPRGTRRTLQHVVAREPDRQEVFQRHADGRKSLVPEDVAREEALHRDRALVFRALLPGP
jgi:hypothetical protein